MKYIFYNLLKMFVKWQKKMYFTLIDFSCVNIYILRVTFYIVQNRMYNVSAWFLYLLKNGYIAVKRNIFIYFQHTISLSIIWSI